MRDQPVELGPAAAHAALDGADCAAAFDQLIAAMGDVCDLFTSVECWNFFKAAGYTS
ncbi:hypothetical protein [Roseovarius sp. D0-M9]|uniref:hypothetical protein n=1 Tax=Roseovarius sp. D0-M9 TaxID=3127117 RepID=UPI00300F7E59